MVSPETQSTVKGWLASIREALHLDEIAQKLNISVETMGQTALYFVVGLVAGFLYKKYGRQLVFAVIICVVALWTLSYLDLLTVHMDNVKALVGFSTTDTVGSVLGMFGTWIKEHIAQVIAGIIGLYLGRKAG